MALLFLFAAAIVRRGLRLGSHHTAEDDLEIVLSSPTSPNAEVTGWAGTK